jgi:hypothetical protein
MDSVERVGWEDLLTELLARIFTNHFGNKERWAIFEKKMSQALIQLIGPLADWSWSKFGRDIKRQVSLLLQQV